MPDATSGLPLYGTEETDKDKPFAVSTTVPGAKPARSLLPTSAVVRVCLIILGVALAAYAVYRVLPVLLLLLVSIMLATAIEPIVTKLRRGPFSRSQGSCTPSISRSTTIIRYEGGSAFSARRRRPLTHASITS